MEHLIGILIVAAIALIGRLSAKSKEAEAEKERAERKLRRDEIPPEVRRRLYGDTDDIPTARPKGEPPLRRAPQPAAPPPRRAAAGQPPMPPAPPRRAPRPDFEDMESYNPETSLEESAASYEEAPMRRDMGAPPLPPQARPPAAQQEDARRKAWQQEQVRQQQARQKQLREEQIRQQRQRQEMQQRQSAAAAAQDQSAQEDAARAPQTRRAPAASRTGRPAAVGGLRELFATPNDLRRAILAQEILGPPRALRGYE